MRACVLLFVCELVCLYMCQCVLVHVCTCMYRLRVCVNERVYAYVCEWVYVRVCGRARVCVGGTGEREEMCHFKLTLPDCLTACRHIAQHIPFTRTQIRARTPVPNGWRHSEHGRVYFIRLLILLLNLRSYHHVCCLEFPFKRIF